ncbi:unnamed protein product [Linum tenue]|uniref:NAC domain-containing protein n=1 Tax=Linum tenue TaxID=586396 RepID=A0AAV0LFV3_9ROSI|nr:unnamed protein product [Linum tenue]
MEEASVVNKEEEMVDLPPGFRFHPTDEEIITHYLTEKVKDDAFAAVAVGEADLNKSEPWDLPSKAKMGEKEWYFFCQRDKKYPTGMRTNRATEAGYWKATGKDKEIFRGRGCLVGMKKTLVFYRGRAPKGQKTNWVMHEYRLHGNFSSFPKASKDEWVVCRVFHKNPAAAAVGGGGGAWMKRSSPMEELLRANSFGNDDFLLDSSLSLPPLMDLPYGDHNHFAKPTSSGAAAAAVGEASSNYGFANNYHLYTFPNPAAGYLQGGGQCKVEQSVVSLSQDTGLSTDNMSAAPEISSAGGKGYDGFEDPTSAGGTTSSELDYFWDNY